MCTLDRPSASSGAQGTTAEAGSWVKDVLRLQEDSSLFGGSSESWKKSAAAGLGVRGVRIGGGGGWGRSLEGTCSSSTVSLPASFPCSVKSMTSTSSSMVIEKESTCGISGTADGGALSGIRCGGGTGAALLRQVPASIAGEDGSSIDVRRSGPGRMPPLVDGGLPNDVLGDGATGDLSGWDGGACFAFSSATRAASARMALTFTRREQMIYLRPL